MGSIPDRSRSRTVLVLLLVAAVALAGCSSPQQGGDGDTASDADETARCDKRSGEGRQATGVRMACRQVEGSGTQQAGFDCGDPNRSAVGVVTNMTDGSVTISVTDPSDATVFEETYQRRGQHNESQRIGRGQAGNWTVTAERSDAFSGTYGVQVTCARG